MTFKYTVRRRSYKFYNGVFENGVSVFLRLGSRLFHSIMVDGKKEFLKKL